MSLPPFPVDDATLLAIEHALGGHLVPDEDGDPVLAGADYSLSGLLDFLSGHTPTGDRRVTYGAHDVISALLREVCRLRVNLEAAINAVDDAHEQTRYCRGGACAVCNAIDSINRALRGDAKPDPVGGHHAFVGPGDQCAATVDHEGHIEQCELPRSAAVHAPTQEPS